MPTSTKPDRQNNRHKSPYQIARTISIECHFRASPILEDRNIDKGINMQLVSDSSWYTNKFEYMWYCTFILIYMCLYLVFSDPSPFSSALLQAAATGPKEKRQKVVHGWDPSKPFAYVYACVQFTRQIHIYVYIALYIHMILAFYT